MRRRLTALAAAATLPVGAAGVAWHLSGDEQAATTAPARAPARIVFVDVGQGDGVVIKAGSTVVLSDAGEFHVDRVERALRAAGRTRRIDVAILSHPHDDHVANYIRLLERGWRIGLAVLPDSAHWEGTRTNRELRALLAQRRVPLRFAVRGDTFRWGGATWEILNPPRGRFTGGTRQAANASIAYLLTVNGVRALFTGDIEPPVARLVAAELESRQGRRVDVFLATHHGSKHGSVQELLDAAGPRWAVLSLGSGNAFRHPASEAVARLKEAGATIWCTAANGTVTARISPAGRLSWQADTLSTPWWSARERRHTGAC